MKVETSGCLEPVKSLDCGIYLTGLLLNNGAAVKHSDFEWAGAASGVGLSSDNVFNVIEPVCRAPGEALEAGVAYQACLRCERRMRIMFDPNGSRVDFTDSL